jgi:hypothetical protein
MNEKSAGLPRTTGHSSGPTSGRRPGTMVLRPRIFGRGARNSPWIPDSICRPRGGPVGGVQPCSKSPLPSFPPVLDLAFILHQSIDLVQTPPASPAQVNGAIGCLTRVPLPHQAFRLGQPVSAASGEATSSEAGPIGGGSRWSKELWNPFLRDTALRVFASCGLSAQVPPIHYPPLNLLTV